MRYRLVKKDGISNGFKHEILEDSRRIPKGFYRGNMKAPK